METPSDEGAHQRLTSSGVVHASNTMRAGPLNVRVTTISRSPSSSIEVRLINAASLPLFATTGFLLFIELCDELVEFLEAHIPDLAIALYPVVKLAQRLRAQLVDALLGARLHVHEPCFLQHAQMLRDLRLPELQALADVVHGARPGAQELDDAEAVRLGKSSQRRDHWCNMPHRAYTCQGI